MIRNSVAVLVACVFLVDSLPSYAVTDDYLVEQVQQAIIHNKLEPRPQCLDYTVTRNSDPGIDRVDVAARHNSECGGDPQLSEHLFSVYIDQKTKQMGTDASDPVNESLKVLPP